jgi:hypothetical protein
MQGNDQPSLIENALSGLAILDVIHILDHKALIGQVEYWDRDFSY